jgi:hypothetical protein
MGKVVRARTRHLKVAEPADLPGTLGEYAGISNIDAGLHEKLGRDTLWLFAKEMYGIITAGDTVADYLGLTEGIGIPVWYDGLRELTTIEDTDEYDRRTVSFPGPHESVAIFHIDLYEDHIHEQRLVSGDAVTDYTEVAVRLAQVVTLLEYEEYQPDSPKWWRGRPDLQIVHEAMPEDSIEA